MGEVMRLNNNGWEQWYAFAYAIAFARTKTVDEEANIAAFDWWAAFQCGLTPQQAAEKARFEAGPATPPQE